MASETSDSSNPALERASKELTLSIAFVRGLVEAVESMGVSREELLQGSTLSVHELGESRVTVARSEIDQLVERAIEITGEPALGLKWWEKATFGAFGAVGHALSVAKSFRAGVGLLENYWPLFVSHPVVTVYDDADVCRIRLHAHTTRLVPYRAYMESGTFVLARFLRQCAGVGGVPLKICFDYPEPSYSEIYRSTFRCPIVFDSEATWLAIAAKDVNRRHLNYATELDAQLRHYADRLMAERHDSERFSARVLSVLRAVPDARRVSMEDVATHLALSERTLRRRLQSERTSFPALSQQVFREQAEAMLRDPARSVKEVAYALGFADPSAFHRAVRRSTGKAPSELREIPEARENPPRSRG